MCLYVVLLKEAIVRFYKNGDLARGKMEATRVSIVSGYLNVLFNEMYSPLLSDDNLERHIHSDVEITKNEMFSKCNSSCNKTFNGKPCYIKTKFDNKTFNKGNPNNKRLDLVVREFTVNKRFFFALEAKNCGFDQENFDRLTYLTCGIDDSNIPLGIFVGFLKNYANLILFQDGKVVSFERLSVNDTHYKWEQLPNERVRKFDRRTNEKEINI